MVVAAKGDRRIGNKIVLGIQEVPASQVMEMGQIMPVVSTS
jgi:hypothetical protein